MHAMHQREGSNCIRRPQASPQQQIRVAKQVHSPHKCWTKETQILTPHLRGQSSHFFNKSHNDRATTSVTQFIHFFTHSPQGISKKVTLLLFNFIPFLQITIILLYDQKMFSCLRISYQSTSWYWMKQFVTTWNKVFWLSY